MELTTINVALLAVCGSLLGVAVTACVNWFIARDNRNKSMNEWRREQLLLRIDNFLDKFNSITSSNNSNHSQYDPSIILEVALKNYTSSDKKAYQICLFLTKKEGIDFIDKYEALKLTTAIETEKMHLAFMTGDHYQYFESKADYSKLNELIAFLSNIIKKSL